MALAEHLWLEYILLDYNRSNPSTIVILHLFSQCPSLYVVNSSIPLSMYSTHFKPSILCYASAYTHLLQ